MNNFSNDTNAMMLFEASKKSTGLAYAIWFFLGLFGGHRFYTGRTGTGIALALLTIIGAGAPQTMLLGVAFIWWVVDAFLLSGWITAHNTELVSKLRNG